MERFRCPQSKPVWDIKCQKAHRPGPPKVRVLSSVASRTLPNRRPRPRHINVVTTPAIFTGRYSFSFRGGISRKQYSIRALRRPLPRAIRYFGTQDRRSSEPRRCQPGEHLMRSRRGSVANSRQTSCRRNRRGEPLCRSQVARRSVILPRCPWRCRRQAQAWRTVGPRSGDCRAALRRIRIAAKAQADLDRCTLLPHRCGA
jgi:hypothetical protein